MCALGSAQEPRKDVAAFQGAVRDSVTGQGIPRASIRLVPGAAGEPGYAGSSNAEGAFRFEAIKPGDYRVEVTHPGYNKQAPSGPAVHFAAGEEREDETRLDPFATIAGRIANADGEPIPGAAVRGVAEAWQRGFRVYQVAAAAEADDNGAYRLRLSAGRYYVSAMRLSDSVIPRTYVAGSQTEEVGTAKRYYPGAPAVDGGALVAVRPGETIGGIDIKLPDVVFRHVRGAIQPTSSQAMAILRPRNGDQTQGSVGGGSLRKDGSFDFRVEPGTYWLELWPPGPRPTGIMPVDVGDRDVNNLRVLGVMPFELKGRVLFDDDGLRRTASAIKLRMQALNWYTFSVAMGVPIGPDGGISLPRMAAARYAISLDPESDDYIKSISYGGRDLAAGIIDLSAGASGDLEIALDSGTGEVEGSAHWDQAIPGAVAVLVSAEGRTGNTGARGVEIGADGRFRFRFAPPGRYRVFVCERFDADLWQNMDLIELVRERGVTVDLTKKATASVEVPPIPERDIRSAIERLPR
jgi:hypothetical protein